MSEFPHAENCPALECNPCAHASRMLPDGRIVIIMPRFGGKAMLAVCRPDDTWGHDDGW